MKAAGQATTSFATLFRACTSFEAQFDISRPGPPQHLAFGTGIHHYLGAALRRYESTAVLGVLITHLDQLIITEAPISHSARP